MNVLVIGSGGREHALIWALKKSKDVGTIFAAPGNGGIGLEAKQVMIALNDPQEVIAFCENETIGLVVIGPEAPLVDGLADHLEEADIPVFGVSGAAAQLEGSKAFTKKLCDTYNIPTAAYESFTDADKAKAYVKAQGAPIVVKADGLAAGKGVILAQTNDEAYEAIDAMLVDNAFGDAGSSVVIEEFLTGEEVSFFALVDGKHALPFGSAQDHKAVGEGDTGPNTGGMGTYSPAPIMTDALADQVMKDIINPVVDGMASDGIPYKGILFAGLMITEQGPKLLEINVRFGDPETQVLMARLNSDLLALMLATAKGDLKGMDVAMHHKAALCVVMASKGYPADYQKGSPIHGLNQFEGDDAVMVFHAGTKRDQQGNFFANGGRVLGVTAMGDTVKLAQTKAYEAVDAIDWPEGFCRRDIGWRAV